MNRLPEALVVPLDGAAPYTVAWCGGGPDSRYRAFREYKRWRGAAIGLVMLCRRWHDSAFIISEDGKVLASAEFILGRQEDGTWGGMVVAKFEHLAERR